MTTLSELQTDLTQKLILDSALALLEESSVHEVTIRGVAKKAGISERTIFRYFSTRDEFLDAIAAALTRNLQMPPNPQTLEELYAMPRTLYGSYEAKAELTRASMHSELFSRMAGGPDHQRWMAIRKLIDRSFPRATEGGRKIAAANIRYFLSATTWHYYRFVLRFGIEETIRCAETAVRQAVDGVRK